jgi:hypothetical protein
MRNTTKLKHVLQLYTVTIDMDEDEKLHLTIIHKNRNSTQTFVDKSYSAVVGKAFSYMMKEVNRS